MTCNLVLRYSYVAHIIIWKIRGELPPAEGLFTGALKEVFQFDNLLRKVGGNPSVAERLIEYERGQTPGQHD